MTEDGFKNVTDDTFERGPLATFGKTLTLYTSTIVKDPITGDKTITYDAGAGITGILHKRASTRFRDKEGFIDLAPAYLMVMPTSTVKVDDKVKDPDTGEVWKVHTALNRRSIYIYCDLYYFEDTT